MYKDSVIYKKNIYEFPIKSIFYSFLHVFSVNFFITEV